MEGCMRLAYPFSSEHGQVVEGAADTAHNLSGLDGGVDSLSDLRESRTTISTAETIPQGCVVSVTGLLEVSRDSFPRYTIHRVCYFTVIPEMGKPHTGKRLCQ